MFKKILVVLLAMGLILPVGVVMAGNGPGGPGGGGGGGGGDIPDTGELYGDLYVILRDVDGVPILDEYGCIQPISGTTDTVTDPVSAITAYPGEPFTLYSYYDSEGVWTPCELTEEMATWVQAVDFGRLNLGRAPEGVIAHAFDEAITKMNAASAFDLDPAGRIMVLLADGWFTIDAPAENLALYIKMMIDGHWITINTDPIVKGGKPEGKGPPEGDGPSAEPRPVLSDSAIILLGQIGYSNLGNVNNQLNNHDLLLAASLLAAAADKTGTITLDKVVYINSVYGINQIGTLTDQKGNKYFNFSNRDNGAPYSQDRAGTYSKRTSGGCGDGVVGVLQPDDENYITFTVDCVEILAYENSGVPHDPTVAGVHFTDLIEAYTTVRDENGDLLEYDFINNVRGFAQAADDALQVIEYIHNYKIPEDLYGLYTTP